MTTVFGIAIIIWYLRRCWNRQTGTFEVRVSLTCGFKSHPPHQKYVLQIRWSIWFVGRFLLDILFIIANVYNFLSDYIAIITHFENLRQISKFGKLGHILA